MSFLVYCFINQGCIDVNDRKLVIKLFLDLQVVKEYFQSKFGVVITKKKMFDFHTSNNPTTPLFVETKRNTDGSLLSKERT